jgi:serine/threonine protein kinase
MSAMPTAEPEDGRLVAGRYRLGRPVGRGGMGTVWLAHDQVLDRWVAIKEVTYPGVVSSDERALLEERTLREARAAARLSSPRTTTVHDVVAEGGRPWIVMEYVESRTLAEVMAASGPLAPIDAARIGLDLLDALEAAHTVDVVHRDVKPGNVLLDQEGRAFLTDFGIATSAGDDTLTEHGVLVGSPSFMAPERARGEEAGPFTDLWSLGATLYAAVEGRGPFDRGEAMATLLAVTSEPPMPPERAGQLGPVLLALLEKEPEQRMTGWAARKALRAMVDEASRPLPPPPRVAPPTSPPPVGPPSAPPPSAPASSSAPPSAPSSSAPPSAAPADSVAKLNREDVAKFAALAGRSFAKGAAKAAVAGLNAWQEKAARSSVPAGRSGPETPAAPPPDRRRTRGRAAPSARSARPTRSAPPGPSGPSAPPARRRHSRMRLPLLVVALVVGGLLISVVLVVVLAVLALG